MHILCFEFFISYKIQDNFYEYKAIANAINYIFFYYNGNIPDKKHVG